MNYFQLLILLKNKNKNKNKTKQNKKTKKQKRYIVLIKYILFKSLFYIKVK